MHSDRDSSRRTGARPEGEFDLVDSLDEGFRPEALVQHLLFGEEHFAGEKDVCLAAFHAWVLFPRDVNQIESTVVIRTFRKIAALEAKCRRDRPRLSPGEVGAKVRSSRKYSGLFDHLYDRLGGANAIVQAPSALKMTRRRLIARKGIRHLSRLISVMHDQIGQGRTPADGRPSMKKSLEVQRLLFADDKWDVPADKQFWDLWREFKPSLAFIYAGYSPLDRSEALTEPRRHDLPGQKKRERPPASFLNSFFRDSPNFEPKRADFRRLVARARFAQEEILLASPSRPSADELFGFPEDVNPEPIPGPMLSAEQSIIARRHFLDSRYRENKQLAASSAAKMQT